MATFVSGQTTITFNAICYPFVYEAERSQNFGESEDGTVRVYDRNVKVEYVKLEIKDTHTNLTALRTFIMDTVKLRNTTFTFTPDAGINAGNADAGAITVRYWGSNFVESQYVYHRYKYIMVLRREIS